MNQEVNPAGAVIGIVIAIAMGWFYFGGGLEQQTVNTMQDIENKVAQDAVDQYGIARRNGSAMDRCVQAGFVSAAYLQAENEARYAEWKRTEADDCAAAGVPK